MSATAATATPSVEQAYRHCEAVTREQAGNFFYGIRLLPGAKRRAMCAVYAFARRVDDIGDGPLAAEQKLALLADARADLERIDAGARDPVLVALADGAARFALPLDAFGDLIAGVQMDVEDAVYERFDQLELYCRRVAGSIGRLSLAIFGSADARGPALADDLGVAMQLTNILRDVREDAERGRVYLPFEDQARFGVDGVLDLSVQPPGAIAALMRFEARRAREWFARGLKLLELLDGRSAACVGAMAGIYQRLLDRIESDPERALAQRLSLPVWEKAWVAARSLTGTAA